MWASACTRCERASGSFRSTWPSLSSDGMRRVAEHKPDALLRERSSRVLHLSVLWDDRLGLALRVPEAVYTELVVKVWQTGCTPIRPGSRSGRHSRTRNGADNAFGLSASPL